MMLVEHSEETSIPEKSGLAPPSDIMTRVYSAYFGTERDRELEAAADQLIAGYHRSRLVNRELAKVGRMAEGRILAVLGESGAGKTRSMQRLFSKRPEFQDFTNREGNGPLVSIVAPSPCTLKVLGRTLLSAMGYDLQRDLRENVVWDLVRQRIRARGIRFIHIDELQHAIKGGNVTEIQKVRDTLKNTMQQPDWPVWLILSGLPSVADFIEGDRQLKRRCRFVSFKSLRFPHDAGSVAAMISQFVKGRAGLAVSHAIDDEVLARLIHASFNQLGTSIEFTQDAIEEAVLSDDVTVGVEHFAAAYAARTGCADSMNVFVARDWHLIDVSKTLGADDADDEVTETPGKKPRNQRNA